MLLKNHFLYSRPNRRSESTVFCTKVLNCSLTLLVVVPFEYEAFSHTKPLRKALLGGLIPSGVFLILCYQHSLLIICETSTTVLSSNLFLHLVQQ